VRGDREPVRLVPHPLQQVQALRAALEHHRVLLPRQPHLLEAFRQAAQCDIGDAELGHGLRRGGDLRRSAVDDDEVRRVGEPHRAASGRVDGSGSQRDAVLVLRCVRSAT